MGCSIGHCFYLDVRWQKLGDITPVEVAMEGFPGKTPSWFIDTYFNKISSDKEVLVITFFMCCE